MLKFSANLSMLFTELPLAQRFSAAKAAGFSSVEIQFPYELSIAELKNLLHENALTLALINIPAGDLMQGGNGLACIAGKEIEFQQAVNTAHQYATALNIPCVNVLSGRKPEHESKEDCVKVLKQNLAYAVEKFEDTQTQVVIEAINLIDMPNFLVHSLRDMRELCSSIAGLKMQFDCYHLHRMGEDVLSRLRDHLSFIGHIQFADSPGRHEPGTGSMDYRPIFSCVKKSDYQGFCGAEYRPSKKTESTLAWLNWFNNAL